MNEREIFLTAMDIADADARGEFLDSACGGDQKLHDRVVRLLQRSLSNDGFLESPASALVDALNPLNETRASDDGSATAAGGLETRTLGDFRILDEIGRGGMGVVYEAEQISLGRRVALKVLAYASILDKTKLDRFKIEARAAASLDHPNVVHVHSVGSRRGVHYYAMQFIEGHTVADLIADERRRRGRHNKLEQIPVVNGSSPDGPTEEFRAGQSSAVSGPEAVKDTDIAEGTVVATVGGSEEKERIGVVVKLAIQAAEALEHAHQMGIVHRDIKPSNLLVDEKQHLWVADFGLAMIEAEGNLTATGNLMGTFRYMSPEQVRGDRHVLDHHTDIYSLGATLYEMLTLRAAFPESDMTQLIKRIPTEEPTSPRKLNSALSRDLETIVLKAMAKDHEDRYASAAAMAEDLRRFIGDEPIRAKPPGPIVRAKKWAKRNRAIVSTGLGTLTVAMLVAGGLLWNERSETFAALARETRQRGAAVTARQQAEDNLQTAIDALDTVYFDAIGEQRLAGSLDLNKELQPLSVHEKNLVESGLVFYQRIAALNDDHPETQFKTAQAHTRVGALFSMLRHDEEAIRSYERALEILEELASEDRNESRYALEVARTSTGLAYQWARKTDSDEFAEHLHRKALRQWDHYLDLEPSDASSYVRRAGVHYALNEPEAVLRDTRRAVELAPDDPLVLRGFARLNTWSGEELWPELVAHARTAVRLLPDDADSRVVLAELLSVGDRQQESIEQFLKAVEINPTNSTAYAKLAARYEHIGEYQKALDAGNKAVALNPQSWFSLHDRGKVYLALGEHEKALADLNRAVELEPRMGLARNTRAKVLQKLNRASDALADLNRAVELEPRSVPTRVWRGSLLVKLHRYEEALQDFDLAAELRPESRWVLGQRGNVLVTLGRYEEALQDYDVVVEQSPTAANYQRRASVNFHLKNFQDALADLNHAVERKPMDVSVVLSISAERVANCPSPEFRDGMRQLADRVVKLNDRSPRALSARLQFFLGLGEWESAQQDLDEILRAEDQIGHYDLYQAALVALATDGQDRYRALCTRMVETFADSSEAMELYFTAWTCALAGGTLKDCAPALALAQKAVEVEPEDRQFLTGLGAIQMRAGRCESALETLKRAASAGEDENTSVAYALYFRAMTENHLDRSEDARRSLARANAQAEQELADLAVPPPWNRRLTLQLLRQEAEVLIGSTESVDEQTNN